MTRLSSAFFAIVTLSFVEIVDAQIEAESGPEGITYGSLKLSSAAWNSSGKYAVINEEGKAAGYWVDAEGTQYGPLAKNLPPLMVHYCFAK